MADLLLLLCFAPFVQAQPQLPPLEPLYRQALADRQAALGSEHPKVAASLVDLALFLMRNGNAAAAEPLLLRARAIYESKDAVALAAVLEKLSEITKDGDKADALLRESLEAHATAGVASRLADRREHAGDLKEAETMYRRALELAAAPAEVASITNNLGLVLEQQDRAADAEKLFAHAAALYEKLYGRTHPEFATTLVNLAGTVRARGDLETAIGMLQNARKILLSTVGGEHPNAQAACQALNDVLLLAGRTAQRGCSLSEPNTPIQ